MHKTILSSLLLTVLSVTLLGEMPRLDSYGSFADIQLEATGFFRLDKLNGRDCFVTPDGHPYIALGANNIGKLLQDDSQNGEILARFGGDEEEAAQHLFQAVRDMAMNAGEAYAPIDPRIKKIMPYVLNVNFPVQGKYQFDIFDPDVQEAFWSAVIQQVAPVRNDRFLLGIACPDLPLWDQRRADFHKQLPVGSPGKKAYEEFYQTHPDATDDDFLGHVADTLYGLVSRAVRQASPNQLFFGERFQLRSNLSDPVIRSVGKYVDVFCSQALIRSPQRPPEWQQFQRDGWDHEHTVTGRPIMIIDWAAPFSLDTPYMVDGAAIKPEAEATTETNQFLFDSFALPYIIGNFKCQLIGSHGNDRHFPEGRMKRTYLKDDGSPFSMRTEATRKAHIQVLNTVLADLSGNE